MSRAEAERHGRRGERAAAWWLRLHGWRIVGERIKTHQGEVDLIARRGRTLIFVEVGISARRNLRRHMPLQVRGLCTILAAMMIVGCKPTLGDFCETSALKNNELRSKVELICASPHGCSISPKACNRGFRFDMKDSAAGAELLNKAIFQSEQEYGGKIIADVTGRLNGTEPAGIEGYGPVPVFLVTAVHSASWKPMFTEEERRRLQKKMGDPQPAEQSVVYPALSSASERLHP